MIVDPIDELVMTSQGDGELVIVQHRGWLSEGICRSADVGRGWTDGRQIRNSPIRCSRHKAPVNC